MVTVLAGVWTVLVAPHSQYGDRWALLPILVAFLLVIAWHVWLVVVGPLRGTKIVYAALHILLWVPFGMLCLMEISKDSF